MKKTVHLDIRSGVLFTHHGCAGVVESLEKRTGRSREYKREPRDEMKSGSLGTDYLLAVENSCISSLTKVRASGSSS